MPGSVGLRVGTTLAILPIMIGAMVLALVITSAIKVYVSHKDAHIGLNATTRTSDSYKAWKAAR